MSTPAADPVDEWLRTPLGVTLLEAERATLAEVVENVFGHHFVQVGHWGPPDWFLPLARVPARTLIADPGSKGGCVSHAGSLAIRSQSVDAVLLPHTLEFEPEPHEVLREVERILAGEGHLIVIGFEPMGVWRARQRLSPKHFAPGLKQVLSRRRLRDWLRLLGFDVLETKKCLRTLPLEGLSDGLVSRGLERATEVLGDRIGSVYVMKAKKRVFTLTPIRPRRRRARAIPGTVVESM